MWSRVLLLVPLTLVFGCANICEIKTQCLGPHDVGCGITVQYGSCVLKHKADVAQMDRASGCDPEGQGFESSCPRQTYRQKLKKEIAIKIYTREKYVVQH